MTNQLHTNTNIMHTLTSVPSVGINSSYKNDPIFLTILTGE